MPKYRNSAFRAFWKSLGPKDKRAYVRRVRTSFVYIATVACGSRRPGLVLARKMVDEGDKSFELYDLRPDFWPKPKREKATPELTPPPAPAHDFTTPADFV